MGPYSEPAGSPGRPRIWERLRTIVRVHKGGYTRAMGLGHGHSHAHGHDAHGHGHGHAHKHDHGHGHGHGHGQAHDDSSVRRLRWALALTLSFLGVEVVAGILTGSLTLLSDAGHMLTDSGALVLALVAQRIASRPRTSPTAWCSR
jgi:cobalt-zinc-cadmium efflux system protein